MEKKLKEIYFIITILFISIIVFKLFIDNEYILKGIIIAIAVYMIKHFGVMKNNNYLKPNVIQVVITCLLSFFIITYLSGLLLGFNKTIFSLKIEYIFRVIILDFILIIAEEFIRYIICKNSYQKKLPIILYTLVLIVLNIIIEINGYDISDKEILFIFSSTVVLPVISRELVCSYMTYNVGYTPSLIYKSIITLYEFILPIIPRLGNYIYSVANVILPYFIYMLSSKIIKYREKAKTYAKKATRRVIYIPIVTILVILTILVAGVFNHKMIAIGSNSMIPAYERGDAIIYKKLTAKDMQEGEILVFQNEGKVITHRIISVQKSGNNYSFRTKGDANNTADTFIVKENQVLGRVEYRIKYIGYPTIWISGIFEGREIGD